MGGGSYHIPYGGWLRRSPAQCRMHACRYWTEAFANPNSAAPEEKIQMIVEMGFERGAAIKALQEAGGDENAALEKLLGQ